MRSVWKLATVAGIALLSAGGSTAICQAQQPPAQQPNQTLSEPKAVRNSPATEANQPQNGVAATATAPAGQNSARENDMTIATMLAIANQEEVSMARLAQSKIQNRDVRTFTDMLIKDHTEMLQKLAQFGGRPGFGEQAGATAQPGQTGAPRATTAQPAATQNGTATADAGGQQAAGGMLDFVSIKRQIAQQCLESARNDMDAKSGMEATKEYVGSQIVAHKQMVDTLKVVRQYASAQLQPVIDEGIKATDMHLDDAKKLMKSLASSEARSSNDTRP